MRSSRNTNQSILAIFFCLLQGFSFAQEFPDFSFTDSEGGQHSKEDYDDRWILLYISSAWIGESQTFIPSLSELKLYYEDELEMVKFIQVEMSSPQERLALGVSEEDIEEMWDIDHTIAFTDGIPDFLVDYITQIPIAFLIAPDGEYELIYTNNLCSYSEIVNLMYQYDIENEDISINSMYFSSSEDSTHVIYSITSNLSESKMGSFVFESEESEEILLTDLFIPAGCQQLQGIISFLNLSGSLSESIFGFPNFMENNLENNVFSPLPSSEVHPPVVNSDVMIVIEVDDFPEELAFRLTHIETQEVVYSAGFSGGTIVGMIESETVTLALSSGVYKVEMFDVQGDGFCCSYGIGGLRISDDSNTEILELNNFQQVYTGIFEVFNETLSKEEHDLGNGVIKTTKWFDLSGKQLRAPLSEGIYVEVQFFENGTVLSQKKINIQ